MNWRMHTALRSLGNTRAIAVPTELPPEIATEQMLAKPPFENEYVKRHFLHKMPDALRATDILVAHHRLPTTRNIGRVAGIRQQTVDYFSMAMVEVGLFEEQARKVEAYNPQPRTDGGRTVWISAWEASTTWPVFVLTEEGQAVLAVQNTVLEEQ